MNRRSFIAEIIAACAAPAVVQAGIIMPIKPKLIMSVRRDIVIGTGTISANGPAVIEIRGTDQYGTRIVERLSVNNVNGAQTKLKFWQIQEVIATTWDNAHVSVKDGLGLDVPVLQHSNYYMRGTLEPPTKEELVRLNHQAFQSQTPATLILT